jgi:L-fuculose-phosphate aldolase
VSIRIPGEEKYWTTVLDRSFGEMTAEDLVLLDFDGNVLDGGNEISPGIGFHAGIYRLRPDVNAIVHTHAFWITAQSVFGRPPRVHNNLGTFFHARTAVAPDDDIESIAPALKHDDVAIIIPWHGAITIGPDIARAASLQFLLEQTCRLDVTLEPTGAQPMPDDHRDAIAALVQTTSYLDLTWEYLRRQAGRAQGYATV